MDGKKIISLIIIIVIILTIPIQIYSQVKDLREEYNRGYKAGEEWVENLIRNKNNMELKRNILSIPFYHIPQLITFIMQYTINLGMIITMYALTIMNTSLYDFPVLNSIPFIFIFYAFWIGFYLILSLTVKNWMKFTGHYVSNTKDFLKRDVAKSQLNKKMRLMNKSNVYYRLGFMESAKKHTEGLK